MVDDNPQFSMILRRLLEGALGYKDVTVLESVDPALELLKTSPLGHFGVLFVDYNFPDGKTGLDLLEEAYRQGYTKGVAAFLVTSEPTVERMKRALAAGAYGMVAKPFNREEIRKQLEKAARDIALDASESF